ncbi:MAG: IclR family transcriptional regulator [Ruminiclostridium sp.]
MEDVKVKSLYKAIKLLDYFTIENPERGITELAELSGMYKSSIHNTVTTFEKCGILQKNLKNNKYRLGLKILQLNYNLCTSDDLRNIMQPYMERVSNFGNESVYLAVPSGCDVVYLNAQYPTGITPGRSIVGVKAPMYCTGVGKAILAFLPEKILDQIVANGFEKYTSNTIVDIVSLKKELALIRERGYAIDNMEHEYGIKCAAVPIKNIRGEIVGAFSISGPSLRFSDQKLTEYANLLTSMSLELRKLIQ